MWGGILKLRTAFYEKKISNGVFKGQICLDNVLISSIILWAEKKKLTVLLVGWNFAFIFTSVTFLHDACPIVVFIEFVKFEVLLEGNLAKHFVLVI